MKMTFTIQVTVEGPDGEVAHIDEVRQEVITWLEGQAEELEVDTDEDTAVYRATVDHVE